MNSPAGSSASREEEIAFLILEQVLGVDIYLADAGAGDRVPDGVWRHSDDDPRLSIVEITTPPATGLMSEWARAKREGRPQSESGSIPLRAGELADVCTELLSASWAQENFEKLLATSAVERHLFLSARGHGNGGHYFNRLSDSDDDGTTEPVGDISLPNGVSDVWFRGRARRDPGDLLGSTRIWVARFNANSGWSRYEASVEEQALPSPNPTFSDDGAPSGWRRPKNRQVPAEEPNPQGPIA